VYLVSEKHSTVYQDDSKIKDLGVDIFANYPGLDQTFRDSFDKKEELQFLSY
jgi:hypothetical protein